jgi:hypothetical protein
MKKRSVAISIVIITVSLRAEDVVIEMPKVPKPPKVIINEETTTNDLRPRRDKQRYQGIPLKKSAPPKKSLVEIKTDLKKSIEQKEDKKSLKIKKVTKEVVKKSSLSTVKKAPAVAPIKSANHEKNLGEVKLGRVSTYLEGSMKDNMDIDKIVSSLKSNGFEIVSTYRHQANSHLTTIIFTSESLKSQADKKDRGFSAVMRVLVDQKSKTVSVTNPVYFLKAFMQDDYSEKIAKETLSKIKSSFTSLKDSTDKLKYSLLAKYHFMFGMPYYNDMIEVASGSVAHLISKLKERGRAAFVVRLSKDRALIGVKLTKKVESFVDIIGTKNAHLLPYPLLLEGGKAKILAPKYYIAISYPLLKMSKFMKISSTPGEIEDEIEGILK